MAYSCVTYRCDDAARRIGRRAVDHRDADARTARGWRRAAPSRCGSRGVVRTSVGQPARQPIDGFEVRASASASGGSGRPSFFAKNVSSMWCATQRRVAAVHAVLEEHDAGDLRVVARREEHEPAVVAQVLVGLARPRPCPAFEMTCAVPVLPDTSCPGILRRAARAARSLTTIHMPSRIACSFSGSSVDLRLRRRRRHRLPPVAIVDRLEQVRRHARAAVGERRHVDGHRHRRHRHRALADRRPRSSRRRTTSRASSRRFHSVDGTSPCTSFGRSMPLFTPRPSTVAHLLILSTPTMLRDRVEVHVARLLDRVAQVDRCRGRPGFQHLKSRP